MQVSAGTVLRSQNRASRRKGSSGRLQDHRRRESVLEETSGWRCPRSSRTGMFGAEQRSGLEVLKSHQHLDRIGSVGGVRSCWESVSWSGKRARAGLPLVSLQPGRLGLTYIPPSCGSNTSHWAGSSLWRRPQLPQSGPDREGAWPGGLPCAHSLVGDGCHVLQQLPRDTLQNGVPEARVAEHVPLAAVDRHHLDAVLRAGVLRPVHLQAQSNMPVMWGPEGSEPRGSPAPWLPRGPRGQPACKAVPSIKPSSIRSL